MSVHPRREEALAIVVKRHLSHTQNNINMTNLGSKFDSDRRALLIFSAQRSDCSLGVVHKATHLEAFFDAKRRLTRVNLLILITHYASFSARGTDGG